MKEDDSKFRDARVAAREAAKPGSGNGNGHANAKGAVIEGIDEAACLAEARKAGA